MNSYNFNDKVVFNYTKEVADQIGLSATVGKYLGGKQCVIEGKNSIFDAETGADVTTYRITFNVGTKNSQSVVITIDGVPESALGEKVEDFFNRKLKELVSKKVTLSEKIQDLDDIKNSVTGSL